MPLICDSLRVNSLKYGVSTVESIDEAAAELFEVIGDPKSIVFRRSYDDVYGEVLSDNDGTVVPKLNRVRIWFT